jgi:mannosyltransferase
MGARGPATRLAALEGARRRRLEMTHAALGPSGAVPRAKVWLALGAVTAVATALRFAGLGDESFWYDEAVAAALARAPLRDLLAGEARDLGNPPLYPALLHLWAAAFGWSDAALRGLSAIAGVATVPLTFGLVRRLTRDASVALGAAALLALSPFHVYLGQEARTFALLTLLGVAALWSLLAAADRPRSLLRWMLHAAAVFASIYAHYFALFLVPACLLVLAARGLLRREVLLPWAVSLAAAALPYLTWLPALLDQVSTAGNLARSAESWQLQVLATPLAWAVGTTLVWKGEDAWTGGLVLAAIATLAMGLAALAAFRRSRRRDAVAIAGWLAPSIAFPIAISALASPLYHVRYVALVAPAFYALVALGLAAVRPVLRAALVVAMLVPAALSIGRYHARDVKHDWRAAAAAIEAAAGDDEPIVFDAGFNETSYAHYATEAQPRLRASHPLVGDPAGAITFVRKPGETPALLAPVLDEADDFWLVLSDAPGEPDRRWAPLLAERRVDAELRFRGIRARRLAKATLETRPPPDLRPAQTAADSGREVK